MGYDTTAYFGPAGSPDPRGHPLDDLVEAAYLRGNCGIFYALRAWRWDGRVSGNAGSQYFSRLEIQVALLRLWAWEAERGYEEGWGHEFFRAILRDWPEGAGCVWVWFC